jgi:hypothetical protein
MKKACLEMIRVSHLIKPSCPGICPHVIEHNFLEVLMSKHQPT